MITLGVTNGESTISVSVITRDADNYDESGYALKGEADDAVPIEADVQPATGRNLVDVAEGVREEVSYMIWTPYDLKNDHTIVYNGENFRVVALWPRREDNFTKAAIGRLKKLESS